MSALGVQGLASVCLVLALVGALAWFARRGACARWTSPARIIAIETAVPLGERRQLVVVNVEGRRLLLGMTPVSVSMVTELSPSAFEARLQAGAAKEGH